MKKGILFFLALAVLLAGCSSPVQWSETDDGTQVMESDRGNTYFYDKWPFDMAIDGMTFTLMDVQFFQKKIDHGYYVSAYVVLDVSSFDDDTLYWIEKDSLIDVSVYVTSEDNGLDFSGMRTVLDEYAGGKRAMIFEIPDESRYSFEGATYTLVVTADQSETYEYTNDEGETHDLNKTDTWHLSDQTLTGLKSPSEAVKE